MRYLSETCCIHCENFLAPCRTERPWTDSTFFKKREITFWTKELKNRWCADTRHFIVLGCGRGELFFPPSMEKPSCSFPFQWQGQIHSPAASHTHGGMAGLPCLLAASWSWQIRDLTVHQVRGIPQEASTVRIQLVIKSKTRLHPY